MNAIKLSEILSVSEKNAGELKDIRNISIAVGNYEKSSVINWNIVKCVDLRWGLQVMKIELYDKNILTNNSYDYIFIKKYNNFFYMDKKLKNIQLMKQVRTTGKSEDLVIFDIDLNWDCYELTSQKIRDRLFFKSEPVILNFNNKQYQDNDRIKLEDYLAGDFSKTII